MIFVFKKISSSSMMRGNNSLLSLCFFLFVFNVKSVLADNKVVVIPMDGEEIPYELTPTTPIINDNVTIDDYAITNDALTSIDLTTKLEWQRQSDDVERNWGDANNYCSALSLNGHDDWHLPNINELVSIVDYGSDTAPLVFEVAFANTQHSRYWSSTNDAERSNRAFVIDFSDGIVSNTIKTVGANVRCVR